MSDHQYLDVFLKDEDRMAKEMLHGFVDKEIMPMRQKTDDETARTYYLSVAYMYDHPETYGPPVSDFMLSKASIAKVYAADVAVMATNKVMERVGSYGYVRDYDVEKHWRDCKIIQFWEGGAQLGRFDVCRGYYDCNL